MLRLTLIYKGLLLRGILRRNDEMGFGIVAIWLSLILYLIIVLRAKIVEKKERKWVYCLLVVAVGFSLLLVLNISLNTVVNFLNNTFGGISRMVVNI